jgi:hypothetical protein
MIGAVVEVGACGGGGDTTGAGFVVTGGDIGG